MRSAFKRKAGWGRGRSLTCPGTALARSVGSSGAEKALLSVLTEARPVVFASLYRPVIGCRVLEKGRGSSLMLRAMSSKRHIVRN